LSRRKCSTLLLRRFDRFKSCRIDIQSNRQKFGVPDIIVYSAANGKFLSIEEEDSDNIINSMASTYFGAFYLIKCFIKDFIERNYGAISIVGSPVLWIDHWAIAYVTSRRALYGFVQALTDDLWDTNIKISYTEPTKIIDGDFFTNNDGVLQRMPFFYRDDIWNPLHQTIDSVGDMVSNTIQNDKTFGTHYTLRFLHFLFPLVKYPLLWTCRMSYLPYQKGGPLSGCRTSIYNLKQTQRFLTIPLMMSFFIIILAVIFILF